MGGISNIKKARVEGLPALDNKANTPCFVETGTVNSLLFYYLRYTDMDRINVKYHLWNTVLIERNATVHSLLIEILHVLFATLLNWWLQGWFEYFHFR